MQNSKCKIQKTGEKCPFCILHFAFCITARRSGRSDQRRVPRQRPADVHVAGKRVHFLAVDEDLDALNGGEIGVTALTMAWTVSSSVSDPPGWAAYTLAAQVDERVALLGHDRTRAALCRLGIGDTCGDGRRPQLRHDRSAGPARPMPFGERHLAPDGNQRIAFGRRVEQRGGDVRRLARLARVAAARPRCGSGRVSRSSSAVTPHASSPSRTTPIAIGKQAAHCSPRLLLLVRVACGIARSLRTVRRPPRS